MLGLLKLIFILAFGAASIGLCIYIFSFIAVGVLALGGVLLLVVLVSLVTGAVWKAVTGAPPSN